MKTHEDMLTYHVAQNIVVHNFYMPWGPSVDKHKCSQVSANQMSVPDE